jgi:predicted nucleic acid-binding protein
MSLVLEGTLDTNILLRFLLGDVPKQSAEARKLIEQPRIWHVSVLSIAEIVFILEGKGFSRSEIKQNIAVLSSYPNLYMARAIVDPALELYVTHPALSFIDTCLVHEASAEQADPLLTFDQKLARQVPGVELVSSGV